MEPSRDYHLKITITDELLKGRSLVQARTEAAHAVKRAVHDLEEEVDEDIIWRWIKLNRVDDRRTKDDVWDDRLDLDEHAPGL